MARTKAPRGVLVPVLGVALVGVSAFAAPKSPQSSKSPHPSKSLAAATSFRVGTAASAPTWVQKACTKHGCRDVLSKLWPMARSETFEFARTSGGQLLAVDAKDGVIGPVAMPGPGVAAWLVASRGRLLGGTSNGVVWTSPTLQSARETAGWSRLVGAPVVSTVVADGAGQWVAFASDDFVYAARWKDGSTPKFTRSTPKSGHIVTQLLVRPDGVMLVQTKHPSSKAESVMIRSGGRWRSSLVKAPRFFRRDDWIWYRGVRLPTVLSKDAKTWVEHRLPPGMMAATRPEWSRSSRPSLLPARSWPGLRWPVAPPGGIGISAASASRKTARGPGTMDLMRIGGGCTGLDCLDKYRAVPSERTTAAFFGDGQCRAMDADTSSPKTCRIGASLSRQPSVALVDRAQVRVALLKPPRGCVPSWVGASRGLVVLLCGARKKQSVYVTAGAKMPASGDAPATEWGAGTSKQTWRFEGRLSGTSPGKVGRVDVAADGTALLSRPCPKGAAAPCEAWVRRPGPLGAPDLWYRSALPRAGGYRVGLGGTALAIIKGAKPTMAEFIVVKDEAKLGARVSVEVPADLRGVWIGDDGTLMLRKMLWGAPEQSFRVKRPTHSGGKGKLQLQRNGFVREIGGKK